MAVYFDTNELKKLAKNFYNLSRTMLSVYDNEYRLLYSYPDKMSDFCTTVRTDKGLAAACIAHDRYAFEQCKKSRSIYTYHCHMGLLEVAFPIINNNVIIGYMLFGQICDDKSRESIKKHIDRAAGSTDIAREDLLSGLDKIKYRTPEYVASISALLEMCANYIWLNNIIKVKSTSLAFSVNEYIQSHLSDDLSVAKLCSVFGISRGALYNLFSEHFGRGISGYIMDRRIAKAKKLLAEDNCNVAETADKTGFHNTDTFIRCFKAREGLTPKQYQKKQRGKTV